MIVLGSAALLCLRLWRGEPLVGVTGDRLSITSVWGRRRFGRDDISALYIWARPNTFVRSGKQTGLAVRLVTGKEYRIGYQPADTDWVRVIAELDEWMLA